MVQAEPQVRRRNAALSAVRPFDQADCMFIEVFIEARIEKLLR